MSRLTGDVTSPKRRRWLLGRLANKEGNFDEIINSGSYAGRFGLRLDICV